jgi:hypothetical protein
MNAQKRKLMIALNEAYMEGYVQGRYQLGVQFSSKELWDERKRKKAEAWFVKTKRKQLEWLANWWDQVLSDNEDLL